MIGKKIRQVVYLKKEIKDYLTIRSKSLVQSYTQRVDWPIEKMGTPFLPPGVEESRREADSNPIMQIEGREILSQLKSSTGFQHFTDIFSRP